MMKIEVGSEWVNDTDESLEYLVLDAGDGSPVNYEVYHNTKFVGQAVSSKELFLLTKSPIDNIKEQAYEEGYVEGYNQHEYEMHQVMSERELDLKAQAFDEGYDQAIDDLIEAGVIEEGEYLDEDYYDEEYSEYEFGDVGDNEEDYCFSKELDKILNGEKAQYKVDPTDLPIFGGRYDENGKLCGFFINTVEASKGDYKLVGISGLARSGKDVAGEIILENLGEGWSRGAFADIPKEMLFVMGVDTKCANKDGEDEYYQYNIRNLMQTLGTEWGRNIDNDIWIKAFKKKNPTGNFVITDVRMENEADFVRDNGGVIIHVKGRGGIKGNHQSEAGIEIKRGDLLVFNDSDLENFEKEISNICKTIVKKV